jgi:hypothetical protein
MSSMETFAAKGSASGKEDEGLIGSPKISTAGWESGAAAAGWGGACCGMSTSPKISTAGAGVAWAGWRRELGRTREGVGGGGARAMALGACCWAGGGAMEWEGGKGAEDCAGWGAGEEKISNKSLPAKEEEGGLALSWRDDAAALSAGNIDSKRPFATGSCVSPALMPE